MPQTLEKAMLTLPAAAAACFFGWTGWLLLLLVGCAAADWITGSVVAWKNGEWSSRAAREGAFRKTGMFLAILCAGVFDMMVYLITNNFPLIQLPFRYKCLVLPLVTVWYICTELGSLIENAGRLGANIPGFLRRAIALLKNSAEKAADGEDKDPKQ